MNDTDIVSSEVGGWAEKIEEWVLSREQIHHRCAWMTCVGIRSQHSSGFLAGFSGMSPRVSAAHLLSQWKGSPIHPPGQWGRRTHPVHCAITQPELRVPCWGCWWLVFSGDWLWQAESQLKPWPTQYGMTPPASPLLCDTYRPYIHGNQGGTQSQVQVVVVTASTGTRPLSSPLGWWLPYSFFWMTGRMDLEKQRHDDHAGVDRVSHLVVVCVQVNVLKPSPACGWSSSLERVVEQSQDPSFPSCLKNPNQPWPFIATLLDTCHPSSCLIPLWIIWDRSSFPLWWLRLNKAELTSEVWAELWDLKGSNPPYFTTRTHSLLLSKP